MVRSSLIRWGGSSMIGAGIATALYWLMALSVGTFTGAEVARTSQWIVAQFLHVLGGLLALFGLMGLYAAQGDRAGALGLLGFIIAFIGTVFYLTDGMIALVIFPVIATYAPTLLNPGGPLLTSRTALAATVFSVTFMIGYVLFAVALLRARVSGRTPAVLLVIGTILSLPSEPLGPFPLPLLSIGGVIWGIAAVWLGWEIASPRTEPAV